MALEQPLSRTETVVADRGLIMTTSWSGESFSRWMSTSTSEDGYKVFGQSSHLPLEASFTGSGSTGTGLLQMEPWASSARFPSRREYKIGDKNANSLSTRYLDDSYPYGSSEALSSLSHPEYNLSESSPTEASPAETLSPHSIYPTTPNSRPNIWHSCLPGSQLSSPRPTPVSVTSPLAYSGARDGGSPFISAMHSPAPEYTDYRGLNDMNNSNHLHEAYPLPLHSDGFDMSPSGPHHQLYTISEPGQEQFVTLSDVASLGDSMITPFASRFQTPLDHGSSVDQPSTVDNIPVAQGDNSPLKRRHVDMAGDTTDGGGSGRKRARTDVPDSRGIKVEEMAPDLVTEARKSRTKSTGRPRGRPRKNPPIPLESFSPKVEPVSPPQPPPPPVHDPTPIPADEGRKAPIRTRRSTLRRSILESDDSDASGEIDDGSDAHDSDVYIPSRSVSPRPRGAARRSSASSGSSPATRNKKRRATRPAGSAAWALRKFEASERGPVDEIQDSTYSTSIPRRTAPVPVPNVTKKSRGRKVPVDAVAQSGLGMGLITFNNDSEISSSSGVVESSAASYDINIHNLSPESYQQPPAAPSTPSLRSLSGTERTGQGEVKEAGSSYYRSRPGGSGDQGAESNANDSQSQHDWSPAAHGKYLGVVSSDVKIVSGGIKKATGERRYVCTVEGCGKCFVRGEHLKRHVRSLHTWDKPHKCPHRGCNKSFSRRDNLGQHVRVHL